MDHANLAEPEGWKEPEPKYEVRAPRKLLSRSKSPKRISFGLPTSYVPDTSRSRYDDDDGKRDNDNDDDLDDDDDREESGFGAFPSPLAFSERTAMSYQPTVAQIYGDDSDEDDDDSDDNVDGKKKFDTQNGDGKKRHSRLSKLSFTIDMQKRKVRELDLSELEDRNKVTNTYEALSAAVNALEKAGCRSMELVSTAELDFLVNIFEKFKIDISSLEGFPYEAPNLQKTVRLLARMQNRCAMAGALYESCSLGKIIPGALVNRSNRLHRYCIGEWVEVRGPSMKWRLELIDKIVRVHDDQDDDNDDDDDDKNQNNDSCDAVFHYSTAVDDKLSEHEIRWPREALRRIFGIGPWVWQQWACLKIEHKLRFQDGHPDDFEVMNIRLYARELWRVWLGDDRNKSFQELFQRVGKSGQDQLIHHIMSPFDLMQEVVSNRDDKWDLEEAGISIFTYVSILGSGFIDAFLVLFIQVTMPLILSYFYVFRAGTDDSNEGDADDATSNGTRPMLFVVLLFYLFKLNRDILSNFGRISGGADTVFSRIQSLRRIVWDDGNDSLAQSLGYTGDMFMNTGYICLLYLFNMWILFNVNDPFEVLGSVVFFEFLFTLDEEIAASSWWDDRFRFLKAGVVGMIMQSTIRREHSINRRLYVERLGTVLTENERKKILHEMEKRGIPDDKTFLRVGDDDDDEDMELLTIAELVERNRASESRAALPEEYYFSDSRKPKVYFSLASDCAMFERHCDLRAWKQWETLLFIFPTPDLVPDDYRAGKRLKIDEGLARREALRGSTAGEGFASGLRESLRFRWHICEVLTCTNLFRSIKAATKLRTVSMFFSRVFHAMFSWVSYTMQLLFPFMTFLALVSVFTPAYCMVNLGMDGHCPAPFKNMSW